ncbi:hypothetical protein K504DRAFT_484532 [Pleomassaria siparia CBS 279.74]|uniref:BTB domain-containing protein n=1 Tax=Pleomassaria siparia CBS 279.74 TaxID=1314801 RepID=A0A6G1JX21_9PLEO|nr:hypothetical protein K504DRAFT_484532 [Pleomassaria siparia CBS 279.74]
MAELLPKKGPLEEVEKLKFSQFLTSPVVAVTVAGTRTFYLHADLLTAESERFSKDLNGRFKEAEKKAIDIEDEDPDLFGFFVEYLYHDRSILSREVQHYSEYVTLARLYAMGERLMAPKFQSYSLWRFTKSLSSKTFISDESICELLRIACTEITERVREDPIRMHMFWYGGTKITDLQKSGMFHQLLCEIPDLGKHLCLWVNQFQPTKPAMPNELQYPRFKPESEYGLQHVPEVPPEH